MAINNYKDGDFLRALEEDIKAQNVELREQMAIAIVEALQQTEEHGDMWELVNDMLNIDEGLVSKLEFLISTSFIERNLDKIEGGRYAN
tara:strand:+ start:3110 stop:3376 length:267 start_codon:yes stop_codon:yes gene_type:complete